MSSFLNDTWFKQRPEYLDALDERLKPIEKLVVRKVFEWTMRRGEFPEDDPDLLTPMLGVTPSAWKKCRESLMLKNKITIQDGLIILMGSEELLAEHLESREKFRKRAVAGGNAKSAKDKKTNDINCPTMLKACSKHALSSAEREIESKEKEKKESFCEAKDRLAGTPVSVDDGLQDTSGHENSKAKKMIWNLFPEFLISKTDKTFEQANSAVGHLSKFAGEDPQCLSGFMQEAINADAEDPVGYVKSKIGQKLKLREGAPPQQITLSTLDKEFKALQVFCKEKHNKTLLNVDSRTWVEKWMYEDFQAFTTENVSGTSE